MKGNLSAFHYATGEPVQMRWQNGLITEIGSAGAPLPQNLWVAPGLVDLQINGYAGIDFQQDGLALEPLLIAAQKLQLDGCTRFFLTLITDEWEKMMKRLEHLRGLRNKSPQLQKHIAGWHIEGPFLSAEPGFCGAHNPDVMCDPTPAHIRQLREVAGTDPLLLTLAPERLEAVATISLAASLGIKVSLGHTNAPFKRLLQAHKAGAVGFTHLANGCPRQIDRHDNILWRVFETSGLKVSVIPDAIHVSPPLFRLIHRIIGEENIYYTTDAMAAAGAPPGKYPLGRLQVEVGEDQIVRLPGSPLFAGSALQPIQGVFRAAEMLNSSWRGVWQRFSDAPADLAGIGSGLKVGQPATFCVLRVTPENWLQSLEVFRDGDMAAKGHD